MKAENQELSATEAVEPKKLGAVELSGRDPRKSFFMALSVTNLDGSVSDLNCGGGEGVEAITETVEEAISDATDLNDCYPTMDVWIYRVVPVARVWRGKARVQKFK